MTIGINENTLRGEYFLEPEKEKKVNSLGGKVALGFLVTSCSLIGLVAFPIFGTFDVIINTTHYIKLRYSDPDTSKLKKEYCWNKLTSSIRMAIPVYGVACFWRRVFKP